LKDIAEHYEADKKKINLVMPIPGTIIVTPPLPDAWMKGTTFKLAERGPVEWIMRVDSDTDFRSGKLV
jgi:hypothetical protein